MELSIIVTSYRNPELLKVCLNSIKKYVDGLDFEIIVADSDTQDETVMMMREEFPEIHFFPFKENVGFQALVRKGFENSQGKYVLMLNGDIIVTENSVQMLLEKIKSDNSIGMVGPKLLYFNGNLQPSCFRFYKPWTIVYRRTILGRLSFGKKHLSWFLMEDYDHSSAKEVDWMMGSAIMLSRAAIEKVGLMDPGFFMYMEDVDWCRRFWEAGYKVIYLPHASMHHFHGKGSAKGGALRSLVSSKYTWIHIASAIKYFIKYWNKKIPQHN